MGGVVFQIISDLIIMKTGQMRIEVTFFFLIYYSINGNFIHNFISVTKADGGLHQFGFYGNTFLMTVLF